MRCSHSLDSFGLYSQHVTPVVAATRVYVVSAVLTVFSVIVLACTLNLVLFCLA